MLDTNTAAAAVAIAIAMIKQNLDSVQWISKARIDDNVK